MSFGWKIGQAVRAAIRSEGPVGPDTVLEAVAANPVASWQVVTHKYILSLIERSFSQDVPADNPLGPALERVRAALASA